MKIRTRFAPSPTGYLHIGGLRTALYNFLFAKKHGGKLVLRIEDTDRTRLVEGALPSLLKTLKATGVVPDEGPYLQSERLKLYQEHAEMLLESGHAYRCFCSRERLEEMRKGQEAAHQPVKYDRACLSLAGEEVKSRLEKQEPHVVRLKVPDGETSFDDVIRGRITIPNREVDDQVLLKSDGFPTYHLAVVVDDHLMKITHVIRGEEWLSSTPKHLMLYRAFGWEAPAFAHLPLILNPDRSKLSKRQGDVAVEDYLAKGYLPEALVNFVALLGWNPKADQELYTLKELTKLFDLEKVNKAGAVFNLEKLQWMNGQYLRRLTSKEIANKCQPFLKQAGIEVEAKTLEKICEVERERLVLLSGMSEKVGTYRHLPSYEASLLVWKKADQEDARQNLMKMIAFLEHQPAKIFSKILLLEEAISRYIKGEQLQNGNVLWPMRVALSGRAASPSPFELAWVLGREETLRRLGEALQLLSA
jgi:glutamyl-tRNA synthetase